MGLISIHAAEWILQNGGDMVIRNYMFWALFLPLGTSWSIDSIRQSIRKHPEHDTNDLNKPMEVASPRIFHLAYLACLVQLAMIYFFNYINKTGSMWSDGSAIHYMYQLDTFLTPLGTWLALAEKDRVCDFHDVSLNHWDIYQYRTFQLGNDDRTHSITWKSGNRFVEKHDF
jgi:hypothetical protein